MTSPTSDIVARLTAERDRHVIGYPGPRRDVAELLDNTLALISSLVEERDAARLCAEYESGDPDAADRFRRILADKAEAERLLAEARETLNWALGCGDDFRGRADGEGAYWWRKELAERAGLTYDRDNGMYVATISIGGGNG